MIVDIALMKIAASNIHHVVRSTGLLVCLVDRPHASRVRSTGLPVDWSTSGLLSTGSTGVYIVDSRHVSPLALKDSTMSG